MASERNPHTRAVPVWAWPTAIVGIVYIACFALLPSPGLWINDNGAKLIQVESIIQGHYRDYSIPWPGAELDRSLRYSPIPPAIGEVRDGRLYVTYSQPFAIVSSIPYRLFGFRGLGLLPLICGLLVLPAVATLAGLMGASRGAQRLAVGIAGLGTPLWFYSLNFWEHTPTLCLGIWSLVLLLRHLRDGESRPLVYSAVLAGLSIYLRADMLLFAAAMIVLLVIAHRKAPRVIGLHLAAFVVTLTPLLVFQWRALGNPLGLHLAANPTLAGSMGGYPASRMMAFRELLLNTHANPWISAVTAAPFLILLALFPRVPERRSDVTGLLVAGLGIAAGLTILAGQVGSTSPMWGLSSSNGLFAVSAVLILGLLREGRARAAATVPVITPHAARSERNPADDLRFLVPLYVLLYCGLAPANLIGIHWGCRFLMPLYPILAVMAACTIARMLAGGPRRTLRIGAVAALLALSLAAQVYSIHLLVKRVAFSARLNRIVAERPERVVVVNGWFLPQDLAPSFLSKTIFLAQRPEDFEGIATLLAGSKEDRALLITWPRGEASGDPNVISLDDGMGFVSVDIQPVALR